MKTAAIYLQNKIITGKNHLEAFLTLTEEEKKSYIVSGFYETDTGEFSSDIRKDHFYNKEIFLIRHGDCEDLSGDPELSSKGKEEIINTINQLNNFNLDGFIGITSPLLRCLQTAAIIQEYSKIEFTVLEDIIEYNCFENNSNVKIENRANDFKEFFWPKTDFSVSHETQTEFLKRIEKVLNKIGMKTILVTHFGVITKMAKLALCEEKIHKVPTASMTYIKNQEVHCFYNDRT